MVHKTYLQWNIKLTDCEIVCKKYKKVEFKLQLSHKGGIIIPQYNILTKFTNNRVQS